MIIIKLFTPFLFLSLSFMTNKNSDSFRLVYSSTVRKAKQRWSESDISLPVTVRSLISTKVAKTWRTFFLGVPVYSWRLHHVWTRCLLQHSGYPTQKDISGFCCWQDLTGEAWRIGNELWIQCEVWIMPPKTLWSYYVLHHW